MRSPRNLPRIVVAGAFAALAGCNLLTGAADLSTTSCEGPGCEGVEGGTGPDGSSSGGDVATIDGPAADTGTTDGGVEGPGGGLDTSFGVGGIVDLDLLVDPFGVAVRADGRILIVGSSSNHLAALALQPNGSVFAGFGTAGRAIRAQNDSSVGRAVAFDSAGRALVGGSANVTSTTTTSYPYVVRFGDTGTDGTFATNGGWRGNGGGEVGTGIITIPGDGVAMCVTDNSDHKIISLTVAGAPDVAYGVGGESQVQSVGGAPAGLVRVTDGFVTGGTGNGATGRGVVAAKVSLAGLPDNGFGAAAKAFSDVGVDDNSDVGTAIAVQSDGALLVAGDYNAKIAMVRRIAAIARFTATGAIDTTYGAGGKVDIDLTEPGVTREAETTIVSLHVDSKGRTIVTGTLRDRLISGGGDRTRAWVARLNANGSFDTTFGTQGKVFLSAPPARVEVAGAAMQADEKLVVVGRNYLNNRLVVARILTSTKL